MGKYLGIPLLGRAPKRNDFNYLIEKVHQKLSGWKATHLSFAGRVTLAKSVIQSIPVYSMMTNPIPKVCLKEIEKLQKGFIWGDSDAGRRLHLVKWDTLMLPKNQGGLGVRNLNDMNKACLMKLAWNLKLEENKLWSQVLIGKYGRGTWASGELQCKAADSYIWKSVADCCEIIKGEEAWSLGDGNTVNFWLDKWLDNHNSLHDIVHNIPPDVMNMKVVDYVDENKRWKLDSLIPLLPGELLNKLLAFLEPDPCMGPDVKYWPGEKSGRFTVSSAHHHLRNVIVAPPVKPWKIIWQLDVPERIRSFVWQITHGKLPTKLYCSSWSGSNSDCRHCLGVSESIQHALRDCPRATAVWKQLSPHKPTQIFSALMWFPRNFSKGHSTYKCLKSSTLNREVLRFLTLQNMIHLVVMDI